MKLVKNISVTLANYIPVLAACLFYKGGAPVEWPLYIVLQVLLVILNFIIANKRSMLIFFNINLLISTVIANKLSVYLYYTNISSDGMTLTIGDLGLIVGVVFVLIISLVSVLLKKKNTKNKEEKV